MTSDLQVSEISTLNFSRVLLSEVHDLSPRIPLDLMVQIHLGFGFQEFQLSTEIFEVIFPEASDLLTRNPLATNDQDLFQLFG
jgi:hypothetical protein